MSDGSVDHPDDAVRMVQADLEAVILAPGLKGVAIPSDAPPLDHRLTPHGLPAHIARPGALVHQVLAECGDATGVGGRAAERCVFRPARGAAEGDEPVGRHVHRGVVRAVERERGDGLRTGYIVVERIVPEQGTSGDRGERARRGAERISRGHLRSQREREQETHGQQEPPVRMVCRASGGG